MANAEVEVNRFAVIPPNSLSILPDWPMPPTILMDRRLFLSLAWMLVSGVEARYRERRPSVDCFEALVAGFAEASRASFLTQHLGNVRGRQRKAEEVPL